jgi:competence protein ComFC
MKRAVTGPSWIYPYYRLLWNSLDWVFPPVCGGCNKLGSRWCGECQTQVAFINGIVCVICGLPVESPGLCRTCELEPPKYKLLRTWAALEDPVQEALHKLKYRRDVSLGDALSKQLVEFVRTLRWPIDVIIPVPLGRKRISERGYNQVGLIAYPLSLALGVGFAPRALMRSVETRSQVGLTRSERRDNVRGAFAAIASRVSGKTILLVDDVATTGSTLSSGAEALLAAGAHDVYALAVARALPRRA